MEQGTTKSARGTFEQQGSTSMETPGKTGETNLGATAHQLVDDAREAAGQAAKGVKEHAATAIADQKKQAVGSLGSVAEALRQTSETLREREPGMVPDYVEKAADQVDRLSDYLRSSSAQDMVRGVEGFARREPALFLGGAFTLGLLAGRLMKSSRSELTSRPAMRDDDYGQYGGEYRQSPRLLAGGYPQTAPARTPSYGTAGGSQGTSRGMSGAGGYQAGATRPGLGGPGGAGATGSSTTRTTPGYTGTSGSSSGTAGYSGTSGASGTGTSGYSGTSGTSGTGTSSRPTTPGTSSTLGTSGTSGASGTSGTGGSITNSGSSLGTGTSGMQRPQMGTAGQSVTGSTSSGMTAGQDTGRVGIGTSTPGQSGSGSTSSYSTPSTTGAGTKQNEEGTSGRGGGART